MFLKPCYPFFQFLLNGYHRLLNLLLRHHIVGRRENGCKVQARLNLPGQNIHLHDPVDLITEKFHPDGVLKGGHRQNLQHVSPHPEGSPLKIQFISYILNVNQSAHDLIPVDLHARPERNHHLRVVLLASDTVNTGHRGDHDDILPLNERRRGAVPQLIDLVID